MVALVLVLMADKKISSKHYKRNIKYVIENDKNTQYLKNKLKKRKVISIKNSVREEIKNRHEILEITDQFNKTLYSTQNEKGFSTCDHLLKVKILIEKIVEYNFPSLTKRRHSAPMNTGH